MVYKILTVDHPQGSEHVRTDSASLRGCSATTSKETALTAPTRTDVSKRSGTVTLREVSVGGAITRRISSIGHDTGALQAP